MDTMDAKTVLNSFLNQCEDRADCFQRNLASNSCMEWFGRTIRGSNEIARYYRHEIWPQYEHNFVTAITCNPFETKPAFMQTKQTPIENKYVRSNTHTEAYNTPPQTIPHTIEPPPVKRYRGVQRVRDDEDSGTNTKDAPEDNAIRVDTEAHGKPAIVRSLRKRILFADDIHKSPSKRSKSIVRPSSASRPEYYEKIGDCASSAKKMHTDGGPCTDSFTQLQYLESIGSIRTIRRSKHPSINRMPNATPTSVVASTSPLVSPESQNGWDRKTKLKISYRIDLTNQEIQYALIIYEPLNMVTRRNLLEEFERAAEEETIRTESTEKSSAQQSKSTRNSSRMAHIKTEKLVSLRRLRF